jgi:hypothetical protein
MESTEVRRRSQWRRGGSKWSRGGSVGPVVADLHHLDEDPDPNQNEKLDPDPH